MNQNNCRTRQVSSMIHSGQTHSHDSSEHCCLLFCFSRFEKWGWMDGRTVNMCENNDPSVTLGWPSGSIRYCWSSLFEISLRKLSVCIMQRAKKYQVQVKNALLCNLDPLRYVYIYSFHKLFAER